MRRDDGAFGPIVVRQCARQYLSLRRNRAAGTRLICQVNESDVSSNSIPKRISPDYLIVGAALEANVASGRSELIS